MSSTWQSKVYVHERGWQLLPTTKFQQTPVNIILDFGTYIDVLYMRNQHDLKNYGHPIHSSTTVTETTSHLPHSSH